MAVPGHDQRDFDFARQFELPIVPVVCSRSALPEGADPAEFRPGDGETAFVEHTADEILINSDRFSGLEAEEGGRAIVEALEESGLGSAEVNFRLHDWCISRQRYWGPPIPIIYCEPCGPQAVPEEDLPVVLPFVEDFRPTDTGVLPDHLPQVRGRGASRDRCLRHVPGFGLVLSSVPVHRIPRPTVRRRSHPEVAAGEQLYRG
jgi:leucyl-tRNA synthetase